MLTPNKTLTVLWHTIYIWKCLLISITNLWPHVFIKKKYIYIYI